MRARKLDQPRGWTHTRSAVIRKRLLVLTTRPAWTDGLKIPASGGCVTVIERFDLKTAGTGPDRPRRESR